MNISLIDSSLKYSPSDTTSSNIVLLLSSSNITLALFKALSSSLILNLTDNFSKSISSSIATSKTLGVDFLTKSFIVLFSLSSSFFPLLNIIASSLISFSPTSLKVLILAIYPFSLASTGYSTPFIITLSGVKIVAFSLSNPIIISSPLFTSVTLVNSELYASKLDMVKL